MFYRVQIYVIVLFFFCEKKRLRKTSVLVCAYHTFTLGG